MKVRVLFIHPTKGMQNATILDADSVDEIKNKLEELGCAVLSAEEEVQ